MASGLFQRYQRDPERWCYQFQTTMFDKRTDYFLSTLKDVEAILRLSDEPQDAANGVKTAVIISERSIMSDICFMRVQRARGHCDKETLDSYLSLNAKWRGLYRGVSPGLVVYCRAGDETDTIVSTCQSRIKVRTSTVWSIPHNKTGAGTSTRRRGGAGHARVQQASAGRTRGPLWQWDCRLSRRICRPKAAEHPRHDH